MLDFILMIIQWIILAVILAVFSLVPLIGMYLAWEGFRDLVKDFQRWELNRRLRRKYGKMEAEAHFVSYCEADVNATLKAYQPDARIGEHIFEFKVAPKRYPTVYDETVAQLHIDPRAELREKKAQDAHDQETLDKATEYRNDIGK